MSTARTPFELATAYTSSRSYAISRLGPGADHEARTAFVAGFEAARSDPEATAPVVRSARDRERERIKAIVGSPEARGRTAMAEQLAYGSDMTADQARALLKSAPEDRHGLLGREQSALLKAALRGAGLSDRVGVLDLAMASEGAGRIASQPGPEPTSATIHAIDAAAIYARRAEQSRPKPAA